MNRTAAIIAITVLAVVVLGVAALAYSYTQISVSLEDIKFDSIDWMDLTFSNLLDLGGKLLTGDILGSALKLVDGVNLNLVFELGNGGLLPVYIPDVTYDLMINGVPVGEGTGTISTTIDPGQTKQVTTAQNVGMDSIAPAVGAIIDSGGLIDIRVRGTAHFGLLGLEIPVPFESSKRISIVNEIEKALNLERRDTEITLVVSESMVRQGTAVSISGRLVDSHGNGLQNGLIYIKDEDAGSGDDVIATVYTDERGEFRYMWTARTMDPFNSVVEIYAVFEGDRTFEPARSAQHDISIRDRMEQETPPPQRNTFSHTSLSIDIPHTTIREGDVLPISGRLVDSHGNGLQNGLIYIKDEDAGSGDDVIATVYTDERGEFRYMWTARTMDPFNSVVEIYAVFEGSPNLGNSRSAQIDIRVR